MISHSSKFKIRWDLFIILLVLYSCIHIPFEIAFDNDRFNFERAKIVGYIIDCFFLVDLLFNFRTTYINLKTGQEVYEPKKIVLNYVLHWRFWVDLLAILPFELIYNLISGSKKSSFSFRVFDVMKLIRLLRLGRIITYLKFK